MARRRGTAGKKKAKTSRKAASTRRSVKRPTKRKAPRGRRTTKKAARPARRTAASRNPRRVAKPAQKTTRRPARAAVRKTAAAKGRKKAPAAATPKAAAAPARLNRERRRLDEVVPTPPSSLDMNRRGSAARTGRAEIAERRQDFASMTPAITGGDVDVNVENAYFTGDEAPGGDNPTPDQDIVDDIGRAIGVEYQDNEELRSSDKVTARDKHRWELDPASAEDYKDRK
jgi:hypothetical protein